MNANCLTINRGCLTGIREDRALDRNDSAKLEMDRFLAGVERRAFRIADIAVRNPDDAMDIVQDAMIRLVRSYSTRAEDEWPPLFFRILQNRIRDHQRHQTVRNRVLSWFRRPDEEISAVSPVDLAPDRATPSPVSQLVIDDSMAELEQAINELPPRQQQAFLLRALQGFDVAATAASMGCSAGSVKTHYSRAVHSLRARLGDHWDRSVADER